MLPLSAEVALIQDSLETSRTSVLLNSTTRCLLRCGQPSFMASSLRTFKSGWTGGLVHSASQHHLPRPPSVGMCSCTCMAWRGRYVLVDAAPGPSALVAQLRGSTPPPGALRPRETANRCPCACHRPPTNKCNVRLRVPGNHLPSYMKLARPVLERSRRVCEVPTWQKRLIQVAEPDPKFEIDFGLIRPLNSGLELDRSRSGIGAFGAVSRRPVGMRSLQRAC